MEIQTHYVDTRARASTGRGGAGAPKGFNPKFKIQNSKREIEIPNPKSKIQNQAVPAFSEYELSTLT
jgi:hypothetical protein